MIILILILILNTSTNTNTNDKVFNRNIWYIDANNLYGYAMMQKLPWVTIQGF